MDRNIVIIVMSALVSIVATWWIFPSVLKLARAKGIVDKPEARKLQSAPVPVLGGVAVFFGLICGLLFGCCFTPEYVALLPVICAATVVLFVGWLDDAIGLSPLSRIIVESLVVVLLIYATGICVDHLHGLFGVMEFSWYVGVPLTVVAGVGIINAFNMIDGVNGLSSCLCITISLLMATFFYKRGAYMDAVIASCFAGALIPFTLHNIFGSRSRMFIGDAGTMVMGLLVTWCVMKTMSTIGAVYAVHIDGTPETMCLPAMLLAIACVPVMDTIRVMTGRLIHGRSPFKADRTHLHHMFIGAGISHSITTVTMVGIDLLVVAVWYGVYKLGTSLELQLAVTIAVSVAMVWGSYFLLRHLEQKGGPLMDRIRRLALATHLGHTRWWLRIQAFLDRAAD